MADPRAYLAPFLSAERRTLSIRDAFAWMNEANASDFFLKVGEPVVFKVDGQVRRLATEPFAEDHLQRFMECFLGPTDLARFNARREVDLVHADEGHRYRVHIGMGNVGPYAVVRRITQDILPLEKIGLPQRALPALQRLRDGLVLIAGPTGQGKTVTAVALLDWIARSRPSMILTLEDPIEYILKDERGFFIQREVGMHVESFADGVRAALRENLDVVFVGEMREPETIEQVLKASEMGHLVISTIHAEDTISALGRIVGSVRPEHEARIRYTLPARFVGCSEPCMNNAMEIVFGEMNMDPNFLSDALAAADDYLYSAEALDFDQQVGESFLPELIQMTRERGVQLILVQMRIMRFDTPGSEPPLLRPYNDALTAYLAANGVIYLDYSRVSSLTWAHYSDGLHMNEAGKAIFTDMFAEDLLENIK